MAGVDRFNDLLCWQLTFKLSVDVFRATSSPPASRDFKFTGQIRDASDSAQRNIAEGFGRFNPPEFARFLDVVRASLNETIPLILKGRSNGYFTTEQYIGLHGLAIRCLQAVARLQRYLRSPEARRNAARRRHQRPHVANNPNVPNLPNVPNVPNDPNAPNDPNE